MKGVITIAGYGTRCLPTSTVGNCGLSLPCGFDGAGLPVGMQVMGPPLGEAQVLRVAHAYEQATAWHTRRPALAQGSEGAS